MENRRGVKVFDIPEKRLPKVERRLRDISEGRYGMTTGYSRFLGLTEGLIKVVRHDLETLRRIGITSDEIVIRMEQVVQKGKRNEKVEVEPGILVEITQTRGMEPCPFATYGDDFKIAPDSLCDGWNGSQDWIITSTDSEITVKTGPLVGHMIWTHQFFGGQISGYRFDPLQGAYVMKMIDTETYEAHKSRVRLYDRLIDDKGIDALIKRMHELHDCKIGSPAEKEFWDLFSRIEIAIGQAREEKQKEMVLRPLSDIKNPELSDEDKTNQIFILRMVIKNGWGEIVMTEFGEEIGEALKPLARRRGTELQNQAFSALSALEERACHGYDRLHRNLREFFSSCNQ